MSDNLTRSTNDALAAMVWRCWRTLGAPAYADRIQHTLVDPEALIVLTAWIARARESRMALTVADWCANNHGILSHIRLRSFVNIAGPDVAAEVVRMVALANGTDPRGVGNIKFTSRPTVDADPAVPIHIDEAAMLRMRLRGLLGPAAKAEALTYLLCVRASDGSTSAALARATRYGQRNLLDALNDLTYGGWLERWRVGRRDYRFQVTDQARRAFGAAPEWLDWASRLCVSVTLSRSAEALDVGTMDGVAQMMSHVHAHEAHFRAAGISLPEWQKAGRFRDADRLHEWIREAVSVVTMVE